MRILTTVIGISPEVGSVCKQCVVSKNNLCTFVLQVHRALWQKKSSRFWMCSPPFPSSYCAQLPCHQHPRGNRGQQAKTSKSKSIVWPLEASPPSFFWQAGRQVGRCSPPRTSLPAWKEPAHRRQVAATEPPHATSNSAFPSRLSCEQPLKPVGNNELAARGLQVDSD